MSIHEQYADIIAGAETVQRMLDGMPRAVDFLPAASETKFAAANCNERWALRSSKRFLDLVIAIPALMVLAPFLIVLSLLIRLDSAGPSLFRQTRLGHQGRPFSIFKFRTMTVLENGARIEQARPDDARTTRIGRWLRAFSLDELPQLINVVKGEMSLVGPRPHALAHDALYARLIPHYGLRQTIKPGITGWAQIHGLRGATPTVEMMSRRVDYDAWYAAHASLALDLKILLRTPLEIIRRRNAY